MGFVTAGNNGGSVIAIPMVAGLITMVGWRLTFAVLAVGLLCIVLLVVLIIRDDAEDVRSEQGKRWAPSELDDDEALSADQGLSVSEAVRTSAFWCLAVGMTLQQFVRTGLVSQMVPHLQQVGFSLSSASVAMMLLAFFAMTSKIIFGRLSETITARLAFVTILVLQAVGLSIMVVSGNAGLTWTAIGIFGMGMGGVGALTPLVILDMFGLKQFGSLMGLTRMPVVIPIVLGPLMAGVIYDATGTYNLMFVVTLGFLLVSVVAFLLARPPYRPNFRTS